MGGILSENKRKKKLEIDIGLIISRIKKRWDIICLAFIFFLALYYRIQPYRFQYLLAIDPYYIYRMSLYAATHSLHLPYLDVLRYYPTYIDPHSEYTGTYIIPAGIFLLLTKILSLNIDFLSFAKIYPAVMGSLFVIPLYYIGREMHSKQAGILAAVFYATTTASMYRTAAGFFEKEPQAGLFMLVSFYFFIRGIKTGSAKSAVISGLSLAIFGTIWGGVKQLYFAYALFMSILLFVNRANERIMKTYLLVFISGMVLATVVSQPIRLKSPYVLLNILVVLLITTRYLAEKYGLVDRKSMDLFMPSMFLGGTLILLVLGFFSTTAANFVMSLKRFAFYQQGVIESTVAENVIPTWGDFTRNLSLIYAAASFPHLSTLFELFPIWLLAFLGILLFAMKNISNEKSKDAKYLFALLTLMLVTFLGYYKFLKVQGSSVAQAAFLFGFISVITMVGRKKPEVTIYLAMVFVAMLGFLSRIRLMFVLGILFSLFSAYLIAELIHRAQRSKFLRQKRKELGILNVFDMGIGFVIAFILLANILNAHSISTNLGPSFNSNWAQAMDFLREKTEPNATVLSWWDFGYWFETMGNRSSNLDGGNNYASRNIPTAQFFTGMMNETQQKFFLEMMGTDYVLVDASMVGKYAAMSKIANFGRKVEAYMTFVYKNAYRQNDKIALVYSAGPYSVWVPVDNNGSLAGKVLLVTPQGEAYIKYLCNSQNIFELETSNDKPVVDGCVLISRRYLLYATKDMMESVFHKLWFMDGKGIDYLYKVFDNGEVKIYKVNHTIIPDRSRDELIKWWEKYNWKGLIVYNGIDYVNQKIDESVFE